MKRPKPLKCLILEYWKLPEDMQEIVKDWHIYNRDCYIPVCSEFEPKDYTIGMKCIEDYYEDQKSTNSSWCKSNNVEEFIVDYGLEFDAWIISQNWDLTGVDKILIKVS